MATLAAQARRARQNRTRRRLNGPEALTNAFLRLQDLIAQPIRAVRNSDGRYMADPAEVDARACQQWGQIYDGNGRDHDAAVRAYVGYNKAHLFQRPTDYKLPAITAADVKAACKGGHGPLLPGQTAGRQQNGESCPTTPTKG